MTTENNKNMTSAELIKKMKEYDRCVNEGGEGFNPYREQLEAAQEREYDEKEQHRKQQWPTRVGH